MATFVIGKPEPPEPSKVNIWLSPGVDGIVNVWGKCEGGSKQTLMNIFPDGTFKTYRLRDPLLIEALGDVYEFEQRT